MKTLKHTVLVLAVVFATNALAFSQESSNVNKQLWAYAFLNWRLNDKWVYNQDLGYQHSYDNPSFTSLFSCSQVNRQISGLFSLHGGINLVYNINESNDNTLEIRPWVGTKLRWPYFWRLNFVHYMRVEERFEITQSVYEWDHHFRLRYELSSDVPINHAAIIDGTLYGLVGYEFFSVSFGDDLRYTTSPTHKFELGLGYHQNIKNSFEFVVLGYMSKSVESDHYDYSDLVFYIKYKRYFNWL